jgi:low temperature requirement protein LtrA
MMFFARRDRSPNVKYLTARVALFFVAAGVWLAGVVTEQPVYTGAAIVILVVAMLLGLYARRGAEGSRETAE